MGSNPTGDMLFCFFWLNVRGKYSFWTFIEVLHAALHKPGTEEENGALCVGGGVPILTGQLSSSFHHTTRLIIFHNPSAIPVPELWWRWLFLFFPVVVFVSQPHLHARADAS